MRGVSGAVYRWLQADGRPWPGLEPRESLTVHTYDRERRAPGEDADAEPGDLAVPLGEDAEAAEVRRAVGGRGTLVRLGDGWHEVGQVSVESFEPDTEAIRSFDGSVIRRAEGPFRVEVTLEGVSPEAVEPPTGGAVPRNWADAHPRSMVRTPTRVDPEWECRACGAETCDGELFVEAGCLTR